MTTNVLFLCPHGAGKSILAATYFRSACARLGVDASATVAGTDPDRDVMPNVAAALRRQGFVITDTPRLVTTDDARAADIVISIGCDHGEIPAEHITEWEAPLLSEDFAGSIDTIHDHAEALARRLARRSHHVATGDDAVARTSLG